LVPSIRRTADLVQEISAAAREQDTGASQINQAIRELDQVIQQNAAAAGEASQVSTELAEQSDRLTGRMSFFRLPADPTGSVAPASAPDGARAATAGGMHASVPSRAQATTRAAAPNQTTPAVADTADARKADKADEQQKGFEIDLGAMSDEAFEQSGAA